MIGGELKAKMETTFLAIYIVLFGWLDGRFIARFPR